MVYCKVFNQQLNLNETIHKKKNIIEIRFLIKTYFSRVALLAITKAIPGTEWRLRQELLTTKSTFFMSKGTDPKLVIASTKNILSANQSYKIRLKNTAKLPLSCYRVVKKFSNPKIFWVYARDVQTTAS